MHRQCHGRSAALLAIAPILIVILLMPGASEAASISGTVREQGSGIGLGGIDIDLLDDRYQLITEVIAFTQPDGSYSMTGLSPGQYFVRADPSLNQGYVDEYHPGVFLQSQALPIVLTDLSTVGGIDFDLALGGSVSGFVRQGLGGDPIAGVDIDIYAADFSFVSSVDASSQIDGSYTIGRLPPGQWYLKADPTTAQGFVRQYYSGADLLSLATPVQILGTENVGAIDFGLWPGGAIAGTVRSVDTGLPIADIDLDLYDSLGQLVQHLDASSDIDGSYEFLSVPEGTYYLEADPSSIQAYIDTWYASAQDLITATPIVVSQGLVTQPIDFDLPTARFIRGTIRASGSGLPLASIDLDVLDLSGNTLTYDGLSLADGSYTIGPMIPGQYLVRADASAVQAYVDQYHPGVFLMSAATPVSVLTADAAAIDFELSVGGSIGGTIRDAVSGLPLASIDLDIFSANMEPIPSVDGDSDGLGVFSVAGLPTGSYLLRADPAVATGYAVMYFNGAADLFTATPVAVTAGGTTPGIDFSLSLSPATAVEEPFGPRPSLGTPSPNPFSHSTTLMMRWPGQQRVRAHVYDLRGRRVRSLGQFEGEGERQLVWDGRDDSGRPLATGTYFLRLDVGAASATQKLLLLR